MAVQQKIIRQALQRGTKLKSYVIDKPINQGGFGIVYLATNLKNHKKVAIKEYLPGDLAVRARDNMTVTIKTHADRENYLWGLSRFLQEAQLVAQYKSHPNIVTVTDLFKSNKSAYMVMEYEGSIDLARYLKKHKTLSMEQIEAILYPLLDALKTIHASGNIHRDIKPGNILISKEGKPILLDFGAARQSIGNLTKPITTLVSKGYAPWEQYQKHSKQGPWTDIYGLSATLYSCVTGNKPVDAIARKSGQDLVPDIKQYHREYSAELLNMIEYGLELEIYDRPQNIDSWIIDSETSIKATPVLKESNKLLNDDTSHIQSITTKWFDISYWLGFSIISYNLIFLSTIESYNISNTDFLLILTPLVFLLFSKLYHSKESFKVVKHTKNKNREIDISKKSILLIFPVIGTYASFFYYRILQNRINKFSRSKSHNINTINNSILVTNLFNIFCLIIIISQFTQVIHLSSDLSKIILFSYIVSLFIQGIGLSLLLRYWNNQVESISNQDNFGI